MFDFLFKRRTKTPANVVVVAPPDKKAELEAAKFAAKQADLIKANSFAGQESAAVDFILQSEFADARYQAAAHLHSVSALTQVNLAMRNADRRVSKFVQEKLNALQKQEELAQANQDWMQKGQALLQSPQLTPNQVMQWEKQRVTPEIHDEALSQLKMALDQRLLAQVELQRQVRQLSSAFDLLAGDALDFVMLQSQFIFCINQLQLVQASPEVASLPKNQLEQLNHISMQVAQIVSQREQTETQLKVRALALAAWQDQVKEQARLTEQAEAEAQAEAQAQAQAEAQAKEQARLAEQAVAVPEAAMAGEGAVASGLLAESPLSGQEHASTFAPIPGQDSTSTSAFALASTQDQAGAVSAGLPRLSVAQLRQEWKQLMLDRNNLSEPQREVLQQQEDAFVALMATLVPVPKAPAVHQLKKEKGAAPDGSANPAGAINSSGATRSGSAGVTSVPVSAIPVVNATAPDHVIEPWLQQLEQALEQGSLQQALDADKNLRGLTLPMRGELAARIALHRSELHRLLDWAKWGGNVSREELCKVADELPKAGLAPQELAKQVGGLRARWKELDRASGSASKAVWERFDQACSRAYEIADEHFKQQAQVRQENLQQAQALLAELDQSIITYQDVTVFKPLIAYGIKLKQEWRKIGPIDRKIKNRLEDEFTEKLIRLNQPLEKARESAVKTRQQ